MTARIEFSEATKRIVAARSAFRCNIPDCGQLTIGPGTGSEETALTGVAAHIFSASPGGPRGSGGLNHGELRSTRNAIWLCADHARLIDTNRGASYPPALLLSYKALHEARISREQNGIYAPLGWFQQLTIENGPVFRPSTTLRLGKVTLIIGRNASGKTLLCKWFASICDPSFLSRWRFRRNEQQSIRMRVVYFDPIERTARLEVGPEGTVKYFVDDAEVPFYPYALRVVFLKTYHYSSKLGQDDLQFIADVLSLDESTIRNLISCVNTDGNCQIHNVRLENTVDGWTLFADVPGTVPGLAFGSLSGSEQAQVLIELAVATARISARYVPTILLLDGGVTSFDSTRIRWLSERLSSPAHLFQTVIVVPNEPRAIDELRWAGWEVIRLIGIETDVTVDQNPL